MKGHFFGASWKRVTSMGAGEEDFLLFEPSTADELFDTVRFFLKKGRKFFPLGAGTNLAGTDRKIDKIGIRLSSQTFSFIERKENIFRTGCGIRLSDFLSRAAEASFGKASALSGIPGTLGGAIRMNAGANGIEIGRFVRSAEGISLLDGSAWKKTFTAQDWSCRSSNIPEEILLLFAKIELFSCDPEEEISLIRKEKLRRSKVTPKGRSAGSVFRNPDKDLPAGKLLDRAGCRGLVSGLASVSMEHANWIVAGPEGCAEKDVRNLICTMAGKVRDQFGIALKNELRFVQDHTKEIIRKAVSGMKILVLKGGTSSEREVSLISGGAVAEALRKGGHEVREYDITKLEVTDDMRWADVVYPVLHGGFGEDGRVQEMLEKAKIRFVGSGSKACRDIMDKIISKKVMDENNIRNAKSVIVDDENAPLPKELSLPLIVKPPCEGSTFGLTLVEEPSAWKNALKLSFEHGKPALVEEFIEGVEATVGIIDGEALPMIEIRYPGKIYDYDAKYTHAHGETKYICPPAGISEASQKEAKDLAVKFYHAIGARDMLRVDVIIGKDGKVWVLEGNALPGCTPSSLLPKAAGVAGITFVEMCSRLALAASKR